MFWGTLLCVNDLYMHWWSCLPFWTPYQDCFYICFFEYTKSYKQFSLKSTFYTLWLVRLVRFLVIIIDVRMHNYQNDIPLKCYILWCYLSQGLMWLLNSKLCNHHKCNTPHSYMWLHTYFAHTYINLLRQTVLIHGMIPYISTITHHGL